MVRTRGHRRRAHSSYRRHRKSSHCHKKGRATCRTTSGCKYTNGKRQYCRKSSNTHASTFRHKQRGGTSIETLPSGRYYALPGASSTYNALSGKKGGRRRRKHHSKRHHSKRHSKRRHSRRRRGGNPAFLTPAVLLAAQKLVQHNGLGL